MIFLPKEWLIKKENAGLVLDILEKMATTDLILEGEPKVDVLGELEKIGETIVAEKFKEGCFAIG